MRPKPKTYPFKGEMRTVREIMQITGLSENAVRHRLTHQIPLVRPKGLKIGDGAIVYGGQRLSQETVNRQRAANKARKRAQMASNPDRYGMNDAKPVTIGGRRFKSAAEAGRFYGICAATATRRRSEFGPIMTEEQFRTPQNAKAKTITVDGVTYPSKAEAARKTGIMTWKL